ncbi:serine/threonine-protein kinase EDR1 isoform X1 [Cucumis melo var. makuwa]|uniref:Serine/threonine-protein kinase EDR1 isoform X1 n=1 Tax=Cucumis melo var. makuwa TaxID=1194695 RepID=A0A5D3C5C9_CUCMM|nr:serine/threonine-protein kinase EDR1 isoform X1 [Cucumis melo var. makuwa]TYK05599.1 serine/threonine-protein kinase EDR1 isoform X1 [Cucumis melo var. makuwa]
MPALELSARKDYEAAQIEAVKQISLGSYDPDNTPVEVIAFRYWDGTEDSSGCSQLDPYNFIKNR